MHIVLSQKHLNHAFRLETSTFRLFKILKNQVDEYEIHRNRICISKLILQRDWMIVERNWRELYGGGGLFCGLGTIERSRMEIHVQVTRESMYMSRTWDN
jgi:hypothetical protein